MMLKWARMFEEVLVPNKTDVLPFLNGSVTLPPRWARVIVNEGVRFNHTIAEYMASAYTICLILVLC
jgi:hypothetical protein